jgi:hypothetical protein
MNMISNAGATADMFNNSRVDLGRSQPVQHTSAERGAFSAEISQFKRAVADWAVGAGFSVLTKKGGKKQHTTHQLREGSADKTG